MTTNRDILELELWDHLRRHLPDGAIPPDAEAPAIEFVAGGWPKTVGETVQFRWTDGELTVVAGFAPDDAVILRYQRGPLIRMDAWKEGSRGVVFDWCPLDADQN